MSRELVKHYLRQGVSVGVFPENFQNRQAKDRLLNAGKHQPVHWQPEENKKLKERTKLLSAWTSTSSSSCSGSALLFLWPFDFRMGLAPLATPLVRKPLDSAWNYTTGFPRPPSWRWQIMGLPAFITVWANHSQ